MFCKCFALWKQPTSVTARVTNVQTMCESFPNQEVDDLTRRLQDEKVKDLLNIQVDLGEIGVSMPQLVPVSSNQGKGDGVQSRLLHESFREHGIVTFPKFLHCYKLLKGVGKVMQCMQLHPEKLWPTLVCKPQTMPSFDLGELRCLAAVMNLLKQEMADGSVVVAGSFPLWLFELHCGERHRFANWLPNDIDVFCTSLHTFVELLMKFTTTFGEFCVLGPAHDKRTGCTVHPKLIYKFLDILIKRHVPELEHCVFLRIWLMATFPRMEHLVVHGLHPGKSCKISCVVKLKGGFQSGKINIVAAIAPSGSEAAQLPAINVVNSFDISVCKVAVQLDGQKLKALVSRALTPPNEPVVLTKDLLSCCTFYTTNFMTIEDIFMGQSTVCMNNTIARMSQRLKGMGLLLPTHHGHCFAIIHGQRVENVPGMSTSIFAQRLLSTCV